MARWVPQEIAEAKRKQDSELELIEVVSPRPKYYFFSHDWPDASVRGLGIAILSVVVFISLAKDYTVSSLLLLGFFAWLAPIAFFAIRSLKVKVLFKATRRSKVDSVNATFEQMVEAAQQKAHVLGEARKFGLYLNLANQTLSQATGGGYQPNLVETLLGNVGSLLLFRLGAPDAENMAAYTRPELGERNLEDLPDHHVVARLLVHGRPSRPFVFRTLLSRESSHTAAHAMVREILRKNRRHYTRPVVEVEKTIQDRRERVMAEAVKQGSVQHGAGACSSGIVDPVSAA
ncbi:MAG: hypothetical protein ACREVK_01175 [Gammaproteobacteria bacterium]